MDNITAKLSIPACGLDGVKDQVRHLGEVWCHNRVKLNHKHALSCAQQAESQLSWCDHRQQGNEGEYVRIDDEHYGSIEGEDFILFYFHVSDCSFCVCVCVCLIMCMGWVTGLLLMGMDVVLS